MTSSWSPTRVFALAPVLESGAVGGLKVGDASDQIEAALGAPQARPGPVDRRRRIWAWTYGNFGVLVSNREVIGIEIEFEGRTPMAVNAGPIEHWSVEAWREFADREDWTLREHASTIQLVSERALVSLASTGELLLTPVGRLDVDLARCRAWGMLSRSWLRLLHSGCP